MHCYATASCTDGNTYVFDTGAEGDRPLHTLGHGGKFLTQDDRVFVLIIVDSLNLDDLISGYDRALTDSGVKFAAWGRTADRFYTGSSDGKVKAWDIRKPKGHAFVRTVLSVAGGITAGAFSDNFSKLLIGDATGKIHILGTEDLNPDTPSRSLPPGNRVQQIPGQTSAVLGKGSRVLISNADHGRSRTLLARKPKILIAHEEPPPPPDYEVDEDEDDDEDEALVAKTISNHLLAEGQLQLHPDPAVGAVQGPNYLDTLWFCKEAHEQEDPSLPLLHEYAVQQRDYSHFQGRIDHLEVPRLPELSTSDRTLHERNMELDLDISRLTLETQKELVRDRADLDFEPDQGFEVELTPRYKLFKEQKKIQKRTNNL